MAERIAYPATVSLPRIGKRVRFLCSLIVVDITVNHIKSIVGWLFGLSVGLEQHSRLLSDGLGLSLRKIRRHAITILIATEGMVPPLWYSHRYNLDGNLEDITPKTYFTCTRCH